MDFVGDIADAAADALSSDAREDRELPYWMRQAACLSGVLGVAGLLSLVIYHLVRTMSG